jgi:hypothetical protein
MARIFAHFYLPDYRSDHVVALLPFFLIFLGREYIGLLNRRLRRHVSTCDAMFGARQAHQLINLLPFLAVSPQSWRASLPPQPRQHHGHEPPLRKWMSAPVLAPSWTLPVAS